MEQRRATGEGFDEAGLWRKLHRYALTAGREVIEKVLWLYYAAQSERTPAWAKSVVYGALVYFVLPIDAIPDLVPGVGYTDDLGALTAAVATVVSFIDDDVKRRASEKMKMWFGAFQEPDGTATESVET